MIEDENNDDEWSGRVLNMERKLDMIVKASQEVQVETFVSQNNELRSQMEKQNKELTSKVETLESKLDLLLEAIKNPSS